METARAHCESTKFSRSDGSVRRLLLGSTLRFTQPLHNPTDTIVLWFFVKFPRLFRAVPLAQTGGSMHFVFSWMRAFREALSSFTNRSCLFRNDCIVIMYCWGSVYCGTAGSILLGVIIARITYLNRIYDSCYYLLYMQCASELLTITVNVLLLLLLTVWSS